MGVRTKNLLKGIVLLLFAAVSVFGAVPSEVKAAHLPTSVSIGGTQCSFEFEIGAWDDEFGPKSHGIGEGNPTKFYGHTGRWPTIYSAVVPEGGDYSSYLYIRGKNTNNSSLDSHSDPECQINFGQVSGRANTWLSVTNPDPAISGQIINQDLKYAIMIELQDTTEAPLDATVTVFNYTNDPGSNSRGTLSGTAFGPVNVAIEDPDNYFSLTDGGDGEGGATITARPISANSLELNDQIYTDPLWDNDNVYYLDNGEPIDEGCTSQIELNGGGGLFGLGGNIRGWGEQLNEDIIKVVDENDPLEAKLFQYNQADCSRVEVDITLAAPSNLIIFHIYSPAQDKIASVWGAGAGSEQQFVEAEYSRSDGTTFVDGTQCINEISIRNGEDPADGEVGDIFSYEWQMRSGSGANCSQSEQTAAGLVIVVDEEQFDEITTVALPSGAEVTCESEGGVLAWVICPVFNRLNDILPTFFSNFVQPLLQFNALSATSSSGGDNNIYSAWRSFRVIANVFFIIVLFAIMFAQTLAINIEAYTIKKMVPRLLVAAIGVQISFFLCGLIVDFNTVLAVGIKGIISSVYEGSGSTAFSLDFSGFGASFNLITAAGIVGVIATMGISILGGALIALLLTAVTLGLRQTILIFMVLVSPIALVAWVLPNTEQYARKWFKNFFQLNFMFPLIVGLITIGDFAGFLINDGALSVVAVMQQSASVLMPTFRAAAQTQAATTAEAVFHLVALIVIIAPYFLIPFTFRFAGGALAFAGGMINNAARRGGLGAQKGIGAGARRGKAYTKKTAAGDTLASRIPGIERAAKTAVAPTIGRLGRRRRAKLENAGTVSALKEFQETGMDRDQEAMELIGMSHQQAKDRANGAVASGQMTQEQANAYIARSKELQTYRRPAGMRAARMASAQSGNVKSEHFEAAAADNSLTLQQRKAHVATLAAASKGAGKLRDSTRYLDENGQLQGGDAAHLQHALATSMSGQDLVRAHRSEAPHVISALQANIASGGDARERALEQIAVALDDENTHAQVRAALNAQWGNDPDVDAVRRSRKAVP